MGFAILRTQKLKDKGSITRSLKHAFREQKTLNADPDRTPQNSHIGADSSQSAIQKIEQRLPEKVRKNAVLTIEYLITASPEDMRAKTREDQDQYFSDALDWLKQRHGAANVVYAGIHRDEKTPHMYAYVVPLDEKHKLNCRKFLGGSKALSQMQTDFAQRVGMRHGLERGIQGSKARHQRVQRFYGNLEQNGKVEISPDEVAPQVLKKGFFSTEHESNFHVADRLNQKIQTQIEIQSDQRLQNRLQAQRIKKLEFRLSETQFELTRLENRFKPLSQDQVQAVFQLAEKFQLKNEQEKRSRRHEFDLQTRSEKQQRKGPKR